MNTNTNAADTHTPTALGEAFDRARQDQDMLAQRREREAAQQRLDDERVVEITRQLTEEKLVEAQKSAKRARALFIAQMAAFTVQVGLLAYQSYKTFKQ